MWLKQQFDRNFKITLIVPSRKGDEKEKRKTKMIIATLFVLHANVITRKYTNPFNPFYKTVISKISKV